MVLERFDHGIGIHLWLCMTVKDELACCTILPNGLDGCCVVFAVKEYVVGERGLCLDGAII